jgi:hypothetical protein
MKDNLSCCYAGLLDGAYDCVDRIVLNAYNSLCCSPGGFRKWWRVFAGSDKNLDNAHLLRFAGRFSRRIRAFAKAKGVAIKAPRRAFERWQRYRCFGTRSFSRCWLPPVNVSLRENIKTGTQLMSITERFVSTCNFYSRIWALQPDNILSMQSP